MGKIKLLAKGLLTNLIFAGILFLCAGKINYLAGWVFLGTNMLATFLNVFSIQDLEIIQERSKIKEGSKSWDKIILGLSSLTYLSTIVIAGLDSGRFLWSPTPHWSIYVVGILLMGIGQLIFVKARNKNRFFSAVVRIQTERGHVVCDQGLYRIVRHPGYLGMMISLMAIPFLVGSLWSLIPTFAAIVLLIVRTILEDKILVKELDGYLNYTQKTKNKLIPHVW